MDFASGGPALHDAFTGSVGFLFFQVPAVECAMPELVKDDIFFFPNRGAAPECGINCERTARYRALGTASKDFRFRDIRDYGTETAHIYIHSPLPAFCNE